MIYIENHSIYSSCSTCVDDRAKELRLSSIASNSSRRNRRKQIFWMSFYCQMLAAAFSWTRSPNSEWIYVSFILLRAIRLYRVNRDIWQCYESRIPKRITRDVTRNSSSPFWKFRIVPHHEFRMTLSS
jgi:hypothetical protein